MFECKLKVVSNLDFFFLLYNSIFNQKQDFPVHFTWLSQFFNGIKEGLKLFKGIKNKSKLSESALNLISPLQKYQGINQTGIETSSGTFRWLAHFKNQPASQRAAVTRPS